MVTQEAAVGADRARVRRRAVHQVRHLLRPLRRRTRLRRVVALLRPPRTPLPRVLLSMRLLLDTQPLAPPQRAWLQQRQPRPLPTPPAAPRRQRCLQLPGLPQRQRKLRIRWGQALLQCGRAPPCPAAPRLRRKTSHTCWRQWRRGWRRRTWHPPSNPQPAGSRRAQVVAQPRRPRRTGRPLRRHLARPAGHPHGWAACRPRARAHPRWIQSRRGWCHRH
jgi:hypothetical protein